MAYVFPSELLFVNFLLLKHISEIKTSRSRFATERCPSYNTTEVSVDFRIEVTLDKNQNLNFRRHVHVPVVGNSTGVLNPRVTDVASSVKWWRFYLLTLPQQPTNGLN